MDPLFLFLLGHFIGDYAFQTDKMVANKRTLSRILILHCAIYTITLAFFAGIHDLLYDSGVFIRVLPWLIPIFLLHISQDLIKSKYFVGSRQFYYLDQALHLAAVYALRIIVGG
ncbi:MAG: DUF3307 domain-containing protein [candidate division Zixibacteria bacterium]